MKTNSIEVSHWNLTKGIIFSLFLPPAIIVVIIFLIQYSDRIDDVMNEFFKFIM